MRLTSAGEVLVATMRRSLADLDAAAAQMAQLRGLVRGSVRIASAESVATDFLPDAIGRYQARHRRAAPAVDAGRIAGSTRLAAFHPAAHYPHRDRTHFVLASREK